METNLLSMVTFITQYWDSNLVAPQYAIFPIILAGIGLASLLTTVIIAILSTDSTPLEGNKICVLGPQEAGKTKLYHVLKGTEYNTYQATQKDPYDSFNFKVGERSFKIAKGTDISGSTSEIKPRYEKMMQENDIIFFLFNVKKYLYETSYQADVKARVEYIWRHFNQDRENAKKHVVIYATHLDTLSDSDKKNALQRLQSSVAGKTYSDLFHNNFFVVDLTSKDFRSKLFELKIWE